jgi:hypothetical protein
MTSLCGTTVEVAIDVTFFPQRAVQPLLAVAFRVTGWLRAGVVVDAVVNVRLGVGTDPTPTIISIFGLVRGVCAHFPALTSLPVYESNGANLIYGAVLVIRAVYHL